MTSLDSGLKERLRRFLSEFQRRKVIRVAAAYAVAGWILLQVAASLENALTLPAWFDTVVLSFLVVGFPVALIASWLFEFTPEGIKRTVDAADGALIRPQTSDWILTAMLVVVLGAAGSQMLMPRSSETPPALTASPPEVKRAPAKVEPSVPERSIAVLPFENLSSDKDNAYFAVGIQDEILTRLTKIGALKVISRTSTAHFASKPDNLPKIAKQLGVAYIVEGNVQREKDTVRITVQLINAATDAHLWAESYDRKLDDIFRVQNEVATAIADALNAKVSGSEKQALAAAPTDNTAAYDAYLRGLASMRSSPGAPSPDATAFLQEAVKLDDSFASAWAALAQAHALFFFSIDASETRRDAARKALDKALGLQPQSVEVLLAQGYYQYWVERDYAGARRRFELVHAKWPNNAEILNALGLIARRQGRWDQAKAYFTQAVTLDPLSQATRFDEAQTLWNTGDFSTAQRHLDEALNIWPDNLHFIGYKASVIQSLGQLDQAEALLKGLRPHPEDEFAIIAIVDHARFRRRYGAAISMLEGLLAQDEAAGSKGWMSSGLNRDLGDLRRLSGDAAGAKANYILARDELLAELERQPKNARLIRNLATVYCSLGERALALKYADRAVALRPIAKDTMDGAVFEERRARIWARFGDRDRAIPALARLLGVPARVPLTPAILRLDPDFDKLRGDPRFEALAAGDASEPSDGP